MPELAPEKLPLAADLPPIDLTGIVYGRLDEYFGLWAMQPEKFQACYQHAVKMDLRAHITDGIAQAVSAPQAAFSVIESDSGNPDDGGGIAVLADPMASIARTGNEPTMGVDLSSPQPGWVVALGACLSPTDL